jgi:hypothetical protein
MKMNTSRFIMKPGLVDWTGTTFRGTATAQNALRVILRATTERAHGTVHDSTGRIRMQRHYTDLFTFTRLIPEVPGDPPVKLLNTSPYQLIRNQHNYYGYFNLEERMVIWATRIWRRLTPPLNQHLFTDRMVFHHMLHHWQNEDITLYQDEDFRIPVTTPIDANQFEVIAYKIVEDCVFDIERLVSEARILAICRLL